ncbi:MAG: M1 family metallopeptidase [Holophagaceae bacterium]|nr:M1 family metallopeptidase [Holophagaceae bacterium]
MLGVKRIVGALGLLVGLGLAGGEPTWTPAKWFDTPLSPRIANYRIQANLDWPGKLVDGKAAITWRNAGTAATDEFPLHLYLNAFRGPQSLFVKESGGRLRGDVLGRSDDAGSWGYCRLKTVKVDGATLRGHYGEDETVYWVKLPRSVKPGESITVDVEWQSRFPKVFARSGWAGGKTPKDATFLMAGQWFPKVGVYQGDKWNCHAYHANTEFFSDFGTYDVELNLPKGLRLAHAGTAIPFLDPDDKQEKDAWPDPKDLYRMVYKLHAEDVHDFAWAVMHKLDWSIKKVPYRGTQVFYFYQPQRQANLRRQQMATEASLRLAGEWFFPYPYPVLTVVDVPEGASGADGMEYPTLITASSVKFDPFKLRFEPEVVTVHEFGHQYFYGLLASNEFEEPWLDEGFTSWFTHKAMERQYHALFASRRFTLETDFGEHAGYWDDPSVDPLTRFGWLTRDNGSYFRVAYAKPTLVLDQLEALLGRPQMEAVMRTYAETYKFRHPTAQDFRKVAEKVSGRDLSAFWRDFVEGTEILDLRILKVQNLPVQAGGWMEAGADMKFAAPQQIAPGRRGRLVLERRGGLALPVTLWVRLEDRSEQRLTWDGRERWAAFDFNSPVVAAVLDPDGNYPMLKDRLHASWARKAPRRGFHYWSQMVWGALTGLLQGAGLG